MLMLASVQLLACNCSGDWLSTSGAYFAVHAQPDVATDKIASIKVPSITNGMTAAIRLHIPDTADREVHHTCIAQSS